MIWLTFAGHFGVTTDKDQPTYARYIYGIESYFMDLKASYFLGNIQQNRPFFGAGVSRNVVKIDERSIFCPKDRQFFAPQAKRRQWIGYSWHLRDMSIFQ